MIFVPLPFAVAVALVFVFASVARRGDHEEAQPNTAFLALIGLAIVQSLLLGLRWGYGWIMVGPVLAMIASIVPPLVYAGVRGLTRKNDVPIVSHIALHLVPTIVVLLLIVFWRQAVDIAIALIFFGYAISILLLTRRGADALSLTAFEDAGPTYRAILFAATALVFSAIVDIFVFFDFEWTRGQHAPQLVTITNLAVLAVLSLAAAAAGRGGMRSKIAETAPDPDMARREEETIGAVRAMMETKHLYRNVDLSLDLLARKVNIPARQISMAINNATGKNVSQYVNEFRIAAACELLATTREPITNIMLDVGFLSKSNFNREFRRVTDMTPLEWRRTKTRPVSKIS